MKDKKRAKYSLPESNADVQCFKRARYKHYVRFLFIAMIAFLFIGLIVRSYDLHIVQHEGFLAKELIIYLLATIMVIPFLPTLIFEVDQVDLTAEALVLRNLFFSAQESWSDLKSLQNPIFLKFAILKGKKTFYLLNKRDLPNFQELIETIERKGINLGK